jgi:hypothetical protein
MVADHFRVNHSIIVRLMQRFRLTGNVTDRPRAGRPRKTTPREDRVISRRTRQRPFSTAGALHGNLAFGGHNSKYTNQTPPSSGNASATTHTTSTVDITSSPCSIWLVTWLFGVDYSHMETGPLVWWKSFSLRPTDGHARVWRQRNISFQDNHILGTTAFGGGGVTVWGCFSFDCKLDLHVLDGNLTGQKYRDKVLAPHVVPHFDNHALADRPMFMDDNPRPHRARIVQHFLQHEAVQTIPWPAMSPDMNPIEHVWDFIGQNIKQRIPKCQNIDELRTAILQERQHFSQERLRCLVRSMTRRVTELHNKRRGYTRYWFICLTHTHNRCI